MLQIAFGLTVFLRSFSTINNLIIVMLLTGDVPMICHNKGKYKSSIFRISAIFLVVLLAVGATACQSLYTSVIDHDSQTDLNEIESDLQNNDESSSTAHKSEIKSTIIEASTSSIETTFSESRNTYSHEKSSELKNENITEKTAEKSANSTSSSNLSSKMLSANLKVHFIDVGQGDSIFIELPNNQTMLIDAGESASGKKVVNYIRRLGYSTIDFVIATHPHSDHIGGMTNVINSLNIGKFYMPNKEHTTKIFENMLDALIENNVDVEMAKTGIDIINMSGLHARFLSPTSNHGSNLNNWSAVVKLDFGQNSFLFMGDAESPVEKKLSNVKADVLKVGHHGSSSSSSLTFLKKVAPKYSIISVGAKNSYGHPTEKTINNLSSIDCKIFRTDLSGTIIATSNGSDISINKEPNSGLIDTVITKKADNKVASNTTKKTATSTKAEQSTIAETKETTSTTSAPTAAKTTTPTKKIDGDVVYITKTGKKYHRENCGHLSKSKIKISKSDAIAQGFEPCKNCKP